MEGSGRTCLVVASQFAQKLDFFDADSLEKIATIEDLIAQPHEIAFDARRRRAYICHTYRSGGYGEGRPKGHEISVVDVDAHRITATIDILPYEAAHDVDYNQATDLIYAGTELKDGRNGLLLIEPDTLNIVANVPTEAPNTHWISVTPDGHKVYCAHKEAPFVTVIDGVGKRVIGRIPCPGGCEELSCSPDGKSVYVAAPKMSVTLNVAQGEIVKAPRPEGEPAPRLLKIDTETDSIVAELEFPEYLAALRVAPDGTVLVAEWVFPDPSVGVVGGPARGRVFFVDGDAMTVAGSVLADELPFTTRVTPNGIRAFTANAKTGSVSVIDIKKREVIAVLDNNIGDKFGGTHGMCIVPPRGVGSQP